METVIEHPENFKDWKEKVSNWNFDATMDDVYNWGDPVIGVHRTYLSFQYSQRGDLVQHPGVPQPGEWTRCSRRPVRSLILKNGALCTENFQRIITDEVPVYSILNRIPFYSQLGKVFSPNLTDALRLDMLVDVTGSRYVSSGLPPESTRVLTFFLMPS